MAILNILDKLAFLGYITTENKSSYYKACFSSLWPAFKVQVKFRSCKFFELKNKTKKQSYSVKLLYMHKLGDFFFFGRQFLHDIRAHGTAARGS